MGLSLVGTRAMVYCRKPMVNRRIWEDNIENGLKEMWCDVIDWICVVQVSIQ